MKNLLFVIFSFCSVICFSQPYSHGKVKVVNSFADYKVRVVSSNADLRIKQVSSFPDKQGEWQFVSSFPDFTIQFVDDFEDFTIEWIGEPYSVNEPATSHNVVVYGTGNERRSLAYGIDQQSCSVIVKHDSATYQLPMAAKVKVVEHDADLRILDASQYAWTNACVQLVDSSYNEPLKCCQWKVVDSDYDYTIQYIRHWFEADIVILFTDKNIGLSRD